MNKVGSFENIVTEYTNDFSKSGSVFIPLEENLANIVTECTKDFSKSGSVFIPLEEGDLKAAMPDFSGDKEHREERCDFFKYYADVKKSDVEVVTFYGGEEEVKATPDFLGVKEHREESCDFFKYYAGSKKSEVVVVTSFYN